MATHVDAARNRLADRGSTPLISTNCTNLKLIIKYDPGNKPKVVFFYAVTVVKTTVNI